MERLTKRMSGISYSMCYVDCSPKGRITVLTLSGCFYSGEYAQTWLAYRQKPEAAP